MTDDLSLAERVRSSAPPSVVLPRLDETAHVWVLDIPGGRSYIDEFGGLLDHGERARAERFQLALPREQFTLGRAALRVLLAHYLDRPVNSLQFAYGPYGKPALAGPSAPAFSVSHSEDVVVVAIARGGAIGVDVERIRVNIDHDEIAAQYFSPTERSRLLQLSPVERRNLFFRYWTSKEATLKAIGDGLTIALDSVEVGLESGSVTSVVRRDASGAQRWFTYELRIADDYAAALAVRSSQLRLEIFDFKAFLRIFNESRDARSLAADQVDRSAAHP